MDCLIQRQRTVSFTSFKSRVSRNARRPLFDVASLQVFLLSSVQESFVIQPRFMKFHDPRTDRFENLATGNRCFRGVVVITSV